MISINERTDDASNFNSERPQIHATHADTATLATLPKNHVPQYRYLIVYGVTSEANPHSEWKDTTPFCKALDQLTNEWTIVRQHGEFDSRKQITDHFCKCGVIERYIQCLCSRENGDWIQMKFIVSGSFLKRLGECALDLAMAMWDERLDSTDFNLGLSIDESDPVVRLTEYGIYIKSLSPELNRRAIVADHGQIQGRALLVASESGTRDTRQFVIGPSCSESGNAQPSIASGGIRATAIATAVITGLKAGRQTQSERSEQKRAKAVEELHRRHTEKPRDKRAILMAMSQEKIEGKTRNNGKPAYRWGSFSLLWEYCRDVSLTDDEVMQSEPVWIPKIQSVPD